MARPRSRDDIRPLNWELPAATAFCWLVLTVLVLPAGQGIASLLAGSGFTWPHGSGGLRRSIAALATGRPDRHAVALPPTALTYTIIVAGELLLLALTVLGLRWWWRGTGPGAPLGMATRREAASVLGTASLKARHHIIRPDLHSKPSNVHILRGRHSPREPSAAGWPLGRTQSPNGVELWVPFDRTAGVYGPQGSGKTLDLLTPALLATPGAALVTLTKVDDLLLTITHRATGNRPVVVLDPFSLAPGLPELVWDPVEGCVDSMVAERRAKAFTAGTVKGAVAGGSHDDAARFYAAEAAKVLQAFFHAAALTGRTLDHVLGWVANPQHAQEPEEILRLHPHAAPFWDGLLRGALHGDARTAGNTATTVQQAMALFFQAPIRARCVPGPGRPATDIADLIASGGTVYLLGRDDPYASASPLLTAIAEHVLDTALELANASPDGRLCPSFLACLDELPSTAPLPTLRTRMANERALGLSFLYAAQTWRQLVICYGEDEARTLFGLTNNVIAFGGGKDGQFYREIADLIGTVRVVRRTYNTGSGVGTTSRTGEDIPILRPEELRQLPQRQVLIIAESARPIVASLRRCIDGKKGQALLAAQQDARAQVTAARQKVLSVSDRHRNALTAARSTALYPRDTSTSGGAR